MFKGKTVLVTGGTGSFGHYIVGRLLSEDPAEVRIFSRDEKKQDEMRYEFAEQSNIRFIIGDVRNRESVKKALRGVDIVYHAAALKQVPSCEYNVYEATETNVIGARNVIEEAIEEDVEKVIAIGTDKAVEPVNAMGMTKALQERLFISANYTKRKSRTILSCVRYGNVVGSRGSVVPLFHRQIREVRAITITDPNMTRFILRLSDAIELVFKATQLAVGGEIFVLKVSAVKITDVAEVMIEALAKTNGVQMKTIGVRPGEKIHEVLVSQAESFRTLERDNLYIVLPQLDLPEVVKNHVGYEKMKGCEYSSSGAPKLDREQTKEMLQKEGWLDPSANHRDYW